jgi:hypothetical protein
MDRPRHPTFRLFPVTMCEDKRRIIAYLWYLSALLR